MDRLPKALLVDLDDTVIAFDVDAEGCWRRACADVLGDAGPVKPEEAHPALMRAADWYWSDPARHRIGRRNLVEARRRIAEGALRRLGIDDRGLAQSIADTYSAVRDGMLHLVPGSDDALRRIRSLGVSLVLVTNGTAEGQREKLTRFGLNGLFDHVLVEGEVGYGKPDPRVYRLAMLRAESTPGRTWMVGDNLVWDVAAPQLLGIHAIWVDYRRTGVPSGQSVRPDRIISALPDLTAPGAPFHME
jgi:putative hydrolase of the HAD superfamily